MFSLFTKCKQTSNSILFVSEGDNDSGVDESTQGNVSIVTKYSMLYTCVHALIRTSLLTVNTLHQGNQEGPQTEPLLQRLRRVGLLLEVLNLQI